MRFHPAFGAFSLLALGVVIGSMLNRPTQAQQPASRTAAPVATPAPAVAPANQSGRFQMRVNVGSDSRVVVTDTTTGQTWTHLPGGGPTWLDFGPPTGSSRR
jgi:hypothetical protein